MGRAVLRPAAEIVLLPQSIAEGDHDTKIPRDDDGLRSPRCVIEVTEISQVDGGVVKDCAVSYFRRIEDNAMLRREPLHPGVVSFCGGIGSTCSKMVILYFPRETRSGERECTQSNTVQEVPPVIHSIAQPRGAQQQSGPAPE